MIPLVANKNMHMRILPLLGLLGLLLTGPTLSAQMIQSLWHADHVGYRLPGSVPQESLVLTLPGFGVGVYSSGFSYNDLVQSTTNNVYTFDIDKVIDQLDPENSLAFANTIQTLGIGFKPVENWYFEVGHNVRFENYFDYPKDLFSVLFQGNAGYIGQTANLGLRVNSMAWSEFYVGAAFAYQNLQVGGRVKFLNGGLSARTERNQLDLYTDEDIYQLTLTSDYLLYTSPELDFLQGESTDPGIDPADYDFAELFTRNTGVGFDIGARLELGEKLTLTADLFDIGRINWKEEVRSYTSQKQVTYEGFEFTSLFTDDSLSVVGALDSLEDLLGFEEGEAADFTTRLPWYFQVGGRYQLNDRVDFSGVIFGQEQGEVMISGFSLGANVEIFRFWEAGINYTLYDQTADNIGLHTLLRLGPVRLYGASDNIISLFALRDSRLANGRVGLQLAFD